MDMPEQFEEDREGYEKWCEMRDAGFWLCAGACGDWKKGTPAAHNGSGPVCLLCEKLARYGCEGPVVSFVTWCPDCDLDQTHIRISTTAIECQECGHITDSTGGTKGRQLWVSGGELNQSHVAEDLPENF